MTQLESVKAIIAFEFKTELAKKRNKSTMNEIGDFATQLEVEIQKKLSRLSSGEDIESILPHTKVCSEA